MKLSNFGRKTSRTIARFDSSGLNCLRGGVPVDAATGEVRFIRHVAGESRVMAEDDVFDDWLAALDRLEEIPEMRFDVVPGRAGEANAFDDRFFAQRVVLGVPLLHVFLVHGARETACVIAGRIVFAGLR